jgi:CO/xanthine dehydrogenase Mo-binding subunit
VKGCGEAGAIGSPPAVINATPEKVWRAIQAAKAGKGA